VVRRDPLEESLERVLRNLESPVVKSPENPVVRSLESLEVRSLESLEVKNPVSLVVRKDLLEESLVVRSPERVLKDINL
jgi:hypothetical protein